MATPQLGTKEYTDYLIKQARALGANQQGVFQSSPPKVSSVAKPGALAKLAGTPAFQAPAPKPGIVPQVYSSSLGGPTAPTSSGGQIDYTRPSSQYVSPVASGSSYAPAPDFTANPNAPRTALLSSGESGPGASTGSSGNFAQRALDALRRAGSSAVGGLTKF